MTRARALKHAIRARAARTGERYTTARRHVLKNLQSSDSLRRPVASPSAPSKVKPKSDPPISDKRFREKTGYGLDHWFDVLDRFGAVEKGHTAAARHLRETHNVGGWYAQGITVAYERARGVRVANQRCDGAYEVSVSKLMPGDARSVVQALTRPANRRRLSRTNAPLFSALWKALDSPSSKGFVIRPDGLGRFRYAWLDTTVQIYVAPKPAGKVSVVATNMKLAGTDAVEERRRMWRDALGEVAKLLAS